MEQIFNFSHNTTGTNPVLNTVQGVVSVRLHELLKQTYYHNSFDYLYLTLDSHKKIKEYIEEKNYECYHYSGSSKEFIVVDDEKNIFKFNIIDDLKTYYKFSYNLYKLKNSNSCDLLDFIISLKITLDINTKINYFYFDEGKGLQSTIHQQKYSPVFLPEAYPNINNIDAYFDDYFNSNKSVLIMIGLPGTGKTSLIRNIAARYTDSNANSDGVFYTASSKALHSDALFQQFISSNSRLMVLEDIDIHLSARNDGNEFMYKLLATSDGFIKSSIEDKKIIISKQM